jgi:hypothetical protein
LLPVVYLFNFDLFNSGYINLGDRATNDGMIVAELIGKGATLGTKACEEYYTSMMLLELCISLIYA